MWAWVSRHCCGSDDCSYDSCDFQPYHKACNVHFDGADGWDYLAQNLSATVRSVIGHHPSPIPPSPVPPPTPPPSPSPSPAPTPAGPCPEAHHDLEYRLEDQGKVKLNVTNSSACCA